MAYVDWIIKTKDNYLEAHHVKTSKVLVVPIGEPGGVVATLEAIKKLEKAITQFEDGRGIELINTGVPHVRSE